MSRFHCTRALTTGLAALALSVLAAAPSPRPAAADGVSSPFREGEVIVTYRGENAAASARVAGRVRATGVQRLNRSGVQRLRLGSGISTAAAIAALSKDPDVAAVQPNYLYHAASTPNDTYFQSNSLWNLNNAAVPGCDVRAPQAWDLSTGSSDVVVAVVDTGVDYNHPDLVDNIWSNPGEVPGNGVDDDRNGWVDDVHGIDTWNYDGDPRDDNGHGTHVAGVIGARGNNSAGVVGINWNVKIIACKFLSSSKQGYTSDAITCLDYLHALKDRGVNIVATNNSWGGGPYDAALKTAIDASASRGILFVAAAGNGDIYGNGVNNDVTAFYPASYASSNIISVAATNSADGAWASSNFGATSVDLAAPGVDVLSTIPNGAYQAWTGTSMATPHVTGAAALLKAYNSALTATQLKDRILQGVDACAAFAGKTVTGGRLNVYRALTASGSVTPAPAPAPAPVPVATAPVAPSSLYANGVSRSQINLSWRNNSTDQTAVYIERSLNGSSWATVAMVSGAATSFADTGLARQTRYYYRVRATNSLGSSPYSNTANDRTGK